MSTTPLPIHRDPEIMGGTPVFVGTPVPAQTLLDNLEGGGLARRLRQRFPVRHARAGYRELEAGAALLIAQTADAA